MGWGKYNKAIILTILSVILIVGFLNIFIDPLNVFHTRNYFNRIKPYIDKNQRISVIPGFKLDKREIDSIWIGSSKTGWGINLEYESKLLNANMASLCLNGSSIEENIEIAKNAIMIHPEIKNIYWGIDFSALKKSNIQKTDTFKFSNKKSITKEELLPVILSFDTFMYTFKNIKKNINKDIEIITLQNYGNTIEYNEKIEHKYKNTIKSYYRDCYLNYELDNEQFNKIKNFINYANSKNVNVVIFTTTMHISERILIDNTNNSNDFNEFKKRLVKIQPYYDFAVVDKYTTDKIRPEMLYFRDAVHANSFVRKKITNQLFLNNEDFGVFVDTKNIEKHITNENKKFKNYLKENTALVEQVKKWSK